MNDEEQKIASCNASMSVQPAKSTTRYYVCNKCLNACDEEEQAERLIIENRNEDGSFDIRGIASDIANLLRNKSTDSQAKPVDGELQLEVFAQVNNAAQKQVNAAYTGQTSPIDISSNVDSIMRLFDAHLQTAMRKSRKQYLIALRAKFDALEAANMKFYPQADIWNQLEMMGEYEINDLYEQFKKETERGIV